MSGVSDYCHHFEEYDDIAICTPEKRGWIMDDEDYNENLSGDEDSDRDTPRRRHKEGDKIFPPNPPGFLESLQGNSSSLKDRSISESDDSSLEGVESQNRHVVVKVDLTEHQCFLLCPRVNAFALKTKQWRKFDHVLIKLSKILSFTNLLSGRSFR